MTETKIRNEIGQAIIANKYLESMEMAEGIKTSSFSICAPHVHPLVERSPSGKRRRKPHELLETGLERLQATIGGLPRDRRRSVLDAMSPKLRCELLLRMEKLCASESQAITPKLKKHSNDAGCQRHFAQHRRTRPKSALRSAKSSGGICQMRTSCGQRYFARIAIGGIAIFSACVRSEEVAKMYQSALAKLRDLFDRSACAVADGPKQDVQSMLADLPADFADQLSAMQLRFRATINARQLVGCTLSSPQVSTLCEALTLRERFLCARQQGWRALRDVWMGSMQVDRAPTRFGHSYEAASVRARALDLRAVKTEQTQGTMPKVSAAKRPVGESAKSVLRASALRTRVIKRLQRLIVRLERLLAHDTSAGKRKRPLGDHPSGERAKKSARQL